MKQEISQLLMQALKRLREQRALAIEEPETVHLEPARDPRHGDFASNIALVLAKPARMPPQELAQAIVAALPESPVLTRVEVAGPGFINFHLAPRALLAVIEHILTQGDRYGCSQIGAGVRVLIEFVSANPTGPLHVGHGRGAAYGAALANLLAEAGYLVEREYYVNDGGRQMDILALSVWLRYLALGGEAIEFPANGYQGEYVNVIAAGLRAEKGNAYTASAKELAAVPADLDPETRLDALIQRARALLGESRFRAVHEYSLKKVLDEIKRDLAGFGVVYDRWFSERQLIESDELMKAADRLKESGHLYRRDGAWWFNASAFGDEKDRVVIRENGQPTYFASDIAYHMDKLERGFSVLIDIWGADHHGYISRLQGVLQAMGTAPERLQCLLVQFVSLYRGEERVPMSTRAGEFVTLRELYQEVGVDATRFFYLMRRCEQHLDFDLELAKSHSSDNPVYYVQYAHARVCSVMRQLAEKGYSWSQSMGNDQLELLAEAEERSLLKRLSYYPDLVNTAALGREPHQIAQYLRELANDFHVYYNVHPFIVPSDRLRNARLNLILATQQVLKNGLRVLGVSAPQRM